jgi:CHASE2 domain-containing sensor protein/two-component sensor histidine kinase
LRPAEAVDERVVIVEINEKDIQSIGAYPIPDHDLARLLRTLQKYQPRAMGIDIVRDLPVDPGHSELVAAFQDIKNLIAIEKVLPPPFKQPPELPPEQIGFADVIVDADGKARRALLGVKRPGDPKKYAFSLPLRLAEVYLEAKGIELNRGILDPNAMRFGSTELPRFLPHPGYYGAADDFGVQVLLNFRSGRGRFPTLSFQDIESGRVNPQVLRDRIILIGITAPSLKDAVDTSAIANLELPGQIYGVEFHAHVTSQIISAVLNRRPPLKTWASVWEYLWIVSWGILAINLSRLTQSPLKSFLYVGAASLSLIALGYAFILGGWWIPIAPALFILVLNGAVLSAFYQYDQALRFQIAVRQQTIDRTFTEIHNGPLQTLANILRHVRDQDLPQNQLLQELENLNFEIRALGEYLEKEALAQKESLLLESNRILDLKQPIHELFYEVYSQTLQRNFPCFPTLKVKIRSFDPIEDQYLSLKQKRELCQFLQEALCNVGKYAKGVTRLSATGKLNQGWYTLCIQDNGSGLNSSAEGLGTKQSRNIAQQLGGKFQREPCGEKGTMCKLTWPISRRNWHLPQIRYRLKTLVQKWLKS